MAIDVKQAVHSFAELSREDVPEAGGKGANLGELAAAGFPVPPGFVVGAHAYAAFCEANGLRARIAQRLESVDVDDSAALEQAAREVRALVESEPVPESLERAIRDAYRVLAGLEGNAPVAVRSSATAEDTEAASFAGMNETFLNVRGEDDVFDAVRRCWGSLFGARTIFYRAKRGFGQADMDIAVIVQRQIASARAGVMFTIDPASGVDRPARDRGRVRARRERRQRTRLARPLRRRQGHARHPPARGAPEGARHRGAARRRHPHADARGRGGEPADALRRRGREARRGRPQDRAPLRLPAGHRVGLRP